MGETIARHEKWRDRESYGLTFAMLYGKRLLMDNSPVIQITDKLPHDVICAALDVKPRSIRLARERQVFPANWYTTMRAICAEYGVDCPESAFNFKSPSHNAPLTEADS